MCDEKNEVTSSITHFFTLVYQNVPRKVKKVKNENTQKRRNCRRRHSISQWG